MTTPRSIVAATPAASWRRALGSLAVLIALLAAYLVWRLPRPAPMLADPGSTLAARVELAGAELTIGNPGDRIWREFRVEVTADAGRFSARLPNLAAGTAVTLGALNLADAAGRRYLPSSMPARSVRIEAEIDGELRFWSGRPDAGA